MKHTTCVTNITCHANTHGMHTAVNRVYILFLWKLNPELHQFGLVFHRRAILVTSSTPILIPMNFCLPPSFISFLEYINTLVNYNYNYNSRLLFVCTWAVQNLLYSCSTTRLWMWLAIVKSGKTPANCLWQFYENISIRTAFPCKMSGMKGKEMPHALNARQRGEVKTR